MSYYRIQHLLVSQNSFNNSFFGFYKPEKNIKERFYDSSKLVEQSTYKAIIVWGSSKLAYIYVCVWGGEGGDKNTDLYFRVRDWSL